MGEHEAGPLTCGLGAFRPSAKGRPGPEAGPPRTGFGHVACVYLDAPTAARADEAVRLVLAAQNGTATFARSAPSCFVGDTAIKVRLGRTPDDPGAACLDVSAKLAPTHLTHLFVVASRVPRKSAEAFWTVFQAARDYVFTVAVAGCLDLGRLYLVKYHVENRLGLRV